MAKKKWTKIETDGFVYSTDPDFSVKENDYDDDSPTKNQQDLRISLRRFKGNKQATIVWNFKGNESDLAELGKFLKSRCGTGGSVKDGEIIIQGDKRKQIEELLKKEGYRCKLAGG